MALKKVVSNWTPKASIVGAKLKFISQNNKYVYVYICHTHIKLWTLTDKSKTLPFLAIQTNLWPNSQRKTEDSTKIRNKRGKDFWSGWWRR